MSYVYSIKLVLVGQIWTQKDQVSNLVLHMLCEEFIARFRLDVHTGVTAYDLVRQ